MMKNTVIHVGFLILFVSFTQLSFAGASKTTSFKMFATLPEHPMMESLSTPQALSSALEKYSPYHQQDDQATRNNKLVIVRSFTVR